MREVEIGRKAFDATEIEGAKAERNAGREIKITGYRLRGGRREGTHLFTAAAKAFDYGTRESKRKGGCRG